MEKIPLILTLLADDARQFLVAIKTYFKDVCIENVGDPLQNLIFPVRLHIRRSEKRNFSAN